jgi:Thioesterase-like superfamily
MRETLSHGPAFYARVDRGFAPQAEASGPWLEGTQNGAAVGGLLATLAESVEAPAQSLPLSLHIEFLRPVPMQTLEPAIEVLRSGKRLQVIRVAIAAGGKAAVVATLVRLRPGSGPTLPVAQFEGVSKPESLPRERGDSPFFSIVDCRIDRGGFDQPGPGAAWLRTTGQIVSGLAPSPFASAVLLADCGSGLSSLVRRQKWDYPNVTLSLHLHRALEPGWLHLDAQTHASAAGVAQVSGILSDRLGQAGHTHQTLCLAPRRGNPQEARFSASLA